MVDTFRAKNLHDWIQKIWNGWARASQQFIHACCVNCLTMNVTVKFTINALWIRGEEVDPFRARNQGKQTQFRSSMYQIHRCYAVVVVLETFWICSLDDDVTVWLQWCVATARWWAVFLVLINCLRLTKSAFCLLHQQLRQGLFVVPVMRCAFLLSFKQHSLFSQGMTNVDPTHHFDLQGRKIRRLKHKMLTSPTSSSPRFNVPRAGRPISCRNLVRIHRLQGWNLQIELWSHWFWCFLNKNTAIEFVEACMHLRTCYSM